MNGMIIHNTTNNKHHAGKEICWFFCKLLVQADLDQ